jgi:hypothetical protein
MRFHIIATDFRDSHGCRHDEIKSLDTIRIGSVWHETAISYHSAFKGAKTMTEQKRLSEISHRIGEALGKELGRRYNVLGNIGKEEAQGDVIRTLKIVDRWGSDADDLSCMIEIRKWNGKEQ